MNYRAEDLLEAADLLRSARRIVVFTGAGASAESGIATFRDEDGLWSSFPPEQFGNWAGLLWTAAARPRRMAEFLLALLEPIAAAAPNEAHKAIAKLQRHTSVSVVTQNVDGLHSEAGSSVVHEIHGTFFKIVTLGGTTVRSISRRQMQQVVESLRRALHSRLGLMRAIRPMLGIEGRQLYRPNVVLFGESMAQPDWQLAQEAVRACDCMISVGTSGSVMPAAGLPHEARSAGTTIIAVDPVGGFGDVRLPGTAAGVLPALVKAAFGG